MIDLVDLGESIKDTRTEMKMSRADLAKLSGVSRARLETLENGRAAEFGYTNIVKILHVLGMDLRLTTANKGRPTLEDLAEEEDNYAPRMGR